MPLDPNGLVPPTTADFSTDDPLLLELEEHFRPQEHDDGRYHVRGYLHDGTDHVVDLVLGRFAAVEFADGEGWVGPERDYE